MEGMSKKKKVTLRKYKVSLEHAEEEWEEGELKNYVQNMWGKLKSKKC